jgi:hypothetical protein
VLTYTDEDKSKVQEAVKRALTRGSVDKKFVENAMVVEKPMLPAGGQLTHFYTQFLAAGSNWHRVFWALLQKARAPEVEIVSPTELVVSKSLGQVSHPTCLCLPSSDL